eukprot:TRINITY_DN1517_c0_g1_i2.p1 TRINITY_DN1517_c0_g1~~TRINITY_DN1517_c0_g1_i2.p1  ORF type:complete len:332 (+),score=73.14 TRINITY_DN1517_c0_g1_i2:50-1045(+)
MRKSIHGQNPQNLIEMIVRNRIMSSRYWNEECFNLTANTVVDKAMELKAVGGTYGGNRKASPFLCLTLKLLTLMPSKNIILEYLNNTEFKYLQCLGAFYLRLVGGSADVYSYLEPFYYDYRKIRFFNSEGQYEVIHIDEFIDQLLTSETVCSIFLPRLVSRRILEDNGTLKPRVSILEEELRAVDVEEDSEEEQKKKKRKHKHKSSRRSSSRSNSEERDTSRESRRSSRRSRRSSSREKRDSRDRHRSSRRSSSREDRSSRRSSRRSSSRESKKPEKPKKSRDYSPDRNKNKWAPKKKEKEPEDSGKMDDLQDIEKMNELRAKLGLKPLLS